MRELTQKLSITNFVMIFFITVIAIVGFSWMADKQKQFKNEIDTLTTLQREQQKENIKKQVLSSVDFIKFKQKQSKQRLEKELQSKVYEGYKVIQSVYDKYKDTKSKEEIIDIIKTALRNVRSFDDRGYFFIISTDYTMILHPILKHLENTKNLKDYTTSDNKKLLDEFNSIVKKDKEGFFEYDFYQESVKSKRRKISFIKLFEPYGIYIGMGEYLDDFDKIVKQEIFDRISQIRFGEDGYLFIDDWDGVILMHPLKPQIVGKNLIGLKDPNGVLVIKELIDASKKPNGDFVYYSWSKPSANNQVMPKVSFAYGIPEYRWMIGGGQYVEDLNLAIVKREEELKRQSQEHIYLTIFLLLLIVLLLFFVIKWWDKKVKSSFDKVVKSFQEASLNHKYLNKDATDFKEFKELAIEFNKMIESRESIQRYLTKTSKELMLANKHLSDSINVASTIQKSIFPNHYILDNFFEEYFIYYQPKDVASGDIYFFERLSNDEVLIFTIDCTGHGISGAFITMLVKAIQQEIMKMHEENSVLYLNDTKMIDTSKVLNMFNFKLKSVLNQENKSSKSFADVGFDGSVLYINKKENVGIYSSAHSFLFILEKDSNQAKYLSSDKCSIGYKKSILDYDFNYHFIDLNTVDTIYLTSDGFIDQIGGPKGFPFAKKQFMKLIENNKGLDLSIQKDNFKQRIVKYQGDHENVDDRMVIALKV
jgi:signal transduction histidine kinase/serine phosphatase RsbU (regulator of sigma subunit)